MSSGGLEQADMISTNVNWLLVSNTESYLFNTQNARHEKATPHTACLIHVLLMYESGDVFENA